MTITRVTDDPGTTPFAVERSTPSVGAAGWCGRRWWRYRYARDKTRHHGATSRSCVNREVAWGHR